MRDRTMIRLGLIFLVVTVFTGVNHAISAYNEMMDTPQAPRAFAVDRDPAGELKIGVLGQRWAVPDPLAAVEAQAPEWQTRVSAWQAQAPALQVRKSALEARMSTLQERMSALRARMSTLQARVAAWQEQAVTRLKQWQPGIFQQKKRL